MKKRFVLFMLVGLMGVLLQLCVLTLLTRAIHVSAVAAAAVAVETTLLHNFLWHERLTWRDRASQASRVHRLWRFQLSNGAVSLFGNTFLTYCFVDRLHASTLLSAVASIGVCGLANFTLADRWVYD